MGKYIFDIEANGIEATKIWCVSYCKVTGHNEQGITHEGVKSITDPLRMKKFFQQEGVTFIGHNIIRYDTPTVERILGVKITGDVIDTLGLSWYLFPHLGPKHGLEVWGDHFKVPKPKIKEGEWLGPLPHETHEQFLKKMVHRCEEDVKINTRLFEKEQDKLLNLYEGDTKAAWKCIKYLNFKLDCAREQEEMGLRVDIAQTIKNIKSLKKEVKPHLLTLKGAMPDKIIYATKDYPAKPFKKDGTDSHHLVQYKSLAAQNGLDINGTEPVKYQKGTESANPNSPDQVKEWLFSLGWEPENFKTNDKGKEVPQVRVDNAGEKQLCPSVLDLAEGEPAINNLKIITVIKHRIGLLKGFLKNCDENCRVQATIGGLANTLRWKHAVVANLPKPSVPYGKLIRGVLIADGGCKFIGSDMSGLESRTKNHFIQPLDPEYVQEMQREGFDPHFDLALIAEAASQDEVDFYAEIKKKHEDKEEVAEDQEAEYTRLGALRHNYKSGNYSCQYSVGATKLSKTLKISKAEAQKIIDTYRKRNWAIREVAKRTKVKTVGKEMWLWNPVANMWYSLRAKKDIFSTLNQGTGDYCFNVWVGMLRREGIKINAQFHDEVLFNTTDYEGDKKILKESIEKTNNLLKLNVLLDIDMQVGYNYGEVH